MDLTHLIDKNCYTNQENDCWVNTLQNVYINIDFTHKNKENFINDLT